MRFAKDFPDELRTQILTSDVVGKKVALKKKGKEFTGLCPFHNEKTPSFSVNDQKGFYHCFGCGAHGDIITFVMQNDGLDFKEAVIKLANDNNIRIPIITENNEEKESKTDRAYLLLEEICQYFENTLGGYSGAEALNYLYKRNLNKEIIKKFRLGFALSSFDALINHFKAKGFNEEELLASGAISKNDNKKLYDKFRGRVIFPITNKTGKIIAFGGRSLHDEQPKYLNSQETELFKKGQNLYNYSSARKAIFDKKFAVIVEGYMDVISLSAAGIENVVAPLGTALTSDQIKELFKITGDVVICLDGDEAGISAMRRAIDIALPLINANHIIRFAFLPNKMDPDDFVKTHGKKLMEDLLKNSKNLSEVLFEYEAKELGITKIERNTSPEKKASLEAKLFQKINLISDINSKKYFSQYYKNLLFDFGKNKNFEQKNFSEKNKISIIQNFDNATIFGAQIIALILTFPDLIDYESEHYKIREISFSSEELNIIKEELIDFYDHHKNSKIDDLILHLEKFSLDNNLKNKIFSNKKIAENFDDAKLKLEIFTLKFHHDQICHQYRELLDRMDDVETDEKSIKEGKQKELFDYKTFLEKKILRLENEIV